MPSGDAATAESRFIMTRSVSVMGRAKAGVDKVLSAATETPKRAECKRVLFMANTLVSAGRARKKIADSSPSGAIF